MAKDIPLCITVCEHLLLKGPTHSPQTQLTKNSSHTLATNTTHKQQVPHTRHEHNSQTTGSTYSPQTTHKQQVYSLATNTTHKQQVYTLATNNRSYTVTTNNRSYTLATHTTHKEEAPASAPCRTSQHLSTQSRPPDATILLQWLNASE